MTTVACYNFNHALEGATVYDDTGNHNGSIVGSVPLSAGPVSSRRRYFDGNSANRINVPHHADFKVNQDWTVEAWVTLTNYGSYPVIWAKGDYNTESLAYLAFDGGCPYSRVGTQSAHWFAYKGTVIPIGALAYVVLTWAQATERLLLYQNGLFILAGTQVGDYNSADNSSPLEFGAINIGGVRQYPFYGYLHALRWSDDIKSAREIYNTYTGAAVRERI